MTRQPDPEAVALARAMDQAAYLVSQALTNREWLTSRGEDFDAILAASRAAHQQARAAYVAYKAGPR